MTEDTLINKIIRSKRRTLGLEITSDASLIIRAPLRASIKDINRVVDQKRSWILEKQKKAKTRGQKKFQYQFIEGEEVLYLGEAYKLRITEDWQRPLDFNGEEFLLARDYECQAKRLFEAWYLKRAEEILEPRVKFFAQIANQPYSRIMISNAKTRWGACNSQRKLHFSWRLMMAPLDKIDYVIAHEVAHLQELNHSKRFWDKLESLMPDYKVHQQWFHDNQYLMSF